MLTVFRQDGFRFFFYSNEGDPREPLHIHVMQAGAEAKLWLEPTLSVARSTGFDARTLRQITAMVAARRDEIERAWHDHFA
jgi:hypothetical protein